MYSSGTVDLLLIHSDEGLKLEISVFESFTVANLLCQPLVDNLLLLVFHFPTNEAYSFFETKSPTFDCLFTMIYFINNQVHSSNLITLVARHI